MPASSHKDSIASDVEKINNNLKGEFNQQSQKEMTDSLDRIMKEQNELQENSKQAAVTAANIAETVRVALKKK